MPNLTEWKEVQLLPTGNGGRDGLVMRMFPGLEKLRITKCPLLKSTPSQFEILRELEIEGVDSEMPLLNLCSNLTSLVKLTVRDVKELTCFPDEMCNNFSLEHLSVFNCREFHELPQNLYNLHSFMIRHCTNFSSLCIPSGEKHLTSLRILELSFCNGLTSLPSGILEHCPSLESLVVQNCENLVSFPLHFGEMPSLSYLNISQCPKLDSVPAGGLHRLTGLHELHIGPFSEIVDFEAFQLIFINDIQQLLSLRTLWIYGRAHWDSLPHQIFELSALTNIVINDFRIDVLPRSLGNLTSLETLVLVRCQRLQHLEFLAAIPKIWLLRICGCPLLEALSDGLGSLVSLRELSFWNCEKLEHLPSRDVMRRLTKLSNLQIKGCPKLEESCTNSQWSNISHIPHIQVVETWEGNSEQILTHRSSEEKVLYY